MYVVATAGHVDHGKSTLVRALTGQDPDRLVEEKRRGLSIRLGYCWTRLEPVGEVAFVDVPGHERFLGTTLSGLAAVPAVLFVVAADDPWMPQAAEHLAALDAVDVRHAVLAVTRADLADPGPALAAAREHLAATSLAGAEAVVVSGHTGQGLDDLRDALVRMLRTVPLPAPEAPVRLWVDRRFAVHGTGTVVTGTLQSGTVSADDRLSSVAGEVRVRTLQCLDTPVDSVRAPARVALDLGGRVPGTLGPGSAVVGPGAFDHVTVVDVRLKGAGRPPARPLLHIGSHAGSVHHRALGPGLARLRLSTPLPLRIGDRAVLRDPGSRAMWGVRVLDTDPLPFRRRGAADIRATELVGFGDGIADQVLSRGLVHRDELRRRGAHDGPLPDGSVEADGWLLSPERVAQLRGELDRLVAGTTDSRGITVEAAARQLGLPVPELVEALVAESPGPVVGAGRASSEPGSLSWNRSSSAVGPTETSGAGTNPSIPDEHHGARIDPAVPASAMAPSLRRAAGRVRAEGDELPEPAARALDALRTELSEAPFAAPPADGLSALGLDPATLGLLATRGLVLRLAESVVLLPDAEDRAVEILSRLPQPFTASQARQALGTSRRVALPLLTLLDKRAHTVRLADDRRRMRR